VSNLTIYSYFCLLTHSDLTMVFLENAVFFVQNPVKLLDHTILSTSQTLRKYQTDFYVALFRSKKFLDFDTITTNVV